MKNINDRSLLEKKSFSTYELKNILNEIEGGKALTDSEIEILSLMFIDKFGFCSGIALNPQLLLDDIEIGEVFEFKEEVFDEWAHKDILNELENKRSIVENIDIDFLCEKPEQCPSFIDKPYGCRCIRENFNTPNDFIEWRDMKVEEFTSKLNSFINKK